MSEDTKAKKSIKNSTVITDKILEDLKYDSTITKILTESVREDPDEFDIYKYIS